MNSGNVIAGYALDNGTIFNFGYAYNRPLQLAVLQPETEQLTASTFLPISTNWKLFGAINYSIIDNTAIEEMAGSNTKTAAGSCACCTCGTTTITPPGFPDFDNPDLQQEHTTQVQFVLKGMGGFGSRITNILEDMIRGYHEREY